MALQLDKKQLNQYSPLTLAFLGDAVYEQLVREKIVMNSNMPAGKLHEIKISKVCASYQSKAFEKIKDILSDEETAVFKRGRNATGNTIPKSADTCEYRRATGVECLFGYLHLAGQTKRIYELFNIMWNMDKEED